MITLFHMVVTDKALCLCAPARKKKARDRQRKMFVWIIQILQPREKVVELHLTFQPMY